MARKPSKKAKRERFWQYIRVKRHLTLFFDRMTKHQYFTHRNRVLLMEYNRRPFGYENFSGYILGHDKTMRFCWVRTLSMWGGFTMEPPQFR